MVKICEINQTAIFAWSSDPLPLLAAGTLAGVMDDSFSSDSFLKIYNPFENNQKKQLLYSAKAPAKFHSLAWNQSDKSHGILAAGLEDNTVQLFDVDKMLKNKSDKLSATSTYKKHTTPVLQVTFNPLEQRILASSGSKGEIFVWDTDKGTSFSPGRAISPVGKVSCLAWNNTVSHIFASAGDTGYTSIWDLKARREVLQLSYAGVPLSVVSWHPNQSTKLVTASGSDLDPVILTWDLRNSSTPEQILKGHRKAILSLDWCHQDSSLLLSSGKDDATMLWNPEDGTRLAQYPSLPNWVHETRFAPSVPDVFASASLDKKIVVRTLQDVAEPAKTKPAPANEAEFWTQISTTDTQHPVFEKQQAPAWLKRPVSAVFGFGGEISAVFTDKDGKSAVKVEKVPLLEGVKDAAESMKDAIEKNNFSNLCESKIGEKSYAAAKDWQMLKEALSKGQKLVLKDLVGEDEEEPKKTKEKKQTEQGESSSSGDDDFFAQLGTAKEAEKVAKYAPSGKFSLDVKDEFGSAVSKLILAKKLDEAVDLCISKDHVTEALVLAAGGSAEMQDKARSAYFAKYAAKDPVARLLYDATSGDISDLVKNADISSWKQIARSVSAYDSSDPQAFNTHISQLGDRILAELSGKDARDSALACYIAGESLGKVASIWSSELGDIESFYLKQVDDKQRGKVSEADIRFKALSEVVEKVLVCESLLSGPGAKMDDLTALGDAFKEYSEFLVGAGELKLASEMLAKVPDAVPGIKDQRERLAKVYKPQPAVRKTTVHPYGVNTAKSTIPNPVTNPINPYTTQHSANPYTNPANPYSAPSAVRPVARPAAPARSTSRQSANPYAPRGNAPRGNAPYGTVPGSPMPAMPIPRPPMAGNMVSSRSTSRAHPLPPAMGVSDGSHTLPPSANHHTGGWNDLPEVLAGKELKKAASTAVRPSPYQLPSRTASGVSVGLGIETPPSYGHLGNASHAPTVPPPPPMAAAKQKPAQSPRPALRSRRSTASSLYQPKVAMSPAMNQPAVNPAATTKSPAVRNPYAPHPQENGAEQGNPYTPGYRGFSGSPAPISGQFGGNRVMSPPPPMGYSAMNSVPPPPKMNVAPHSVPPPPKLNSTPQSIPPPSKMSAQAVPAQPVPLEQPQPRMPITATTGDDRSEIGGIPDHVKPIVTILSGQLDQVKPKIPEKFARQVTDCEKRLQILFAKLEGREGLKGIGEPLNEEATTQLLQLCEALQAGDYAKASTLQAKISANYPEQCGEWMVGVRRLIGMAKATAN